MKGLLLKMLNAVHSFRLALVLKQLHRHIKLKLKRTLKNILKKSAKLCQFLHLTRFISIKRVKKKAIQDVKIHEELNEQTDHDINKLTHLQLTLNEEVKTLNSQ